MSGKPPFSLSDFLDEAGIDPENIDADETERINDALAELNPELYGTGRGDGGSNTGPPTLDGSLDNNEFPGGSLQEFGASISASGNTAVVGAPGTDLGDGDDEGVAQVFERSNGSFQQVATLTASEPGDRVGENVDIDGNTAVVGAPGTVSGDEYGEIYVYERSGDTWDTSPVFQLTDADDERGEPNETSGTVSPPDDYPRFGEVLEFQGDIIATLARGGPDARKAGLLVFRRTENSPTEWTWIRTYIDFGDPADIPVHVATNGEYVLLTNSYPDINQVARVFPVDDIDTFDDTGPGTEPVSEFGAVGDIVQSAGDTYPTILIGAANEIRVYEAGADTDGFGPDFDLPEEVSETLSGPTGVGFGTSSLAADGTTAVVGAPSEPMTDGTGAVYRFERGSGSWSQVDRITAPSGVTNFGTSLSLGPSTIYVGDGSNVYTYTR
ncbi:hypothetical protein [Halorubrum sp. N11]|uniref:FG-GAP repeat protein n=1 Tax=Halorubrum sp. N11 TaxID=3402276 RepID=UPI003EB91EDB